MMRKKIIFLAKFIPIPAHNGAAIRTLSWIRFLSRKYDIFLVGLSNDGIKLDEEQNFFGCQIFSEKRDRSIGKKIKDLFGWIFQKRPYIFRQYYSPALQEKVAKIWQDNEIEFVYCSEISDMQYADFSAQKKVPVYFDDHNVEYELYGAMAEFMGFPLDHFLRRESRLIKKFEKKSLDLAKHVFCVSEVDRKKLNELAGDKDKITAVNHCFEDNRKKRGIASSKPTMVFAGTLSWPPNKHGMEHFIKKIFPQIVAAVPDVGLDIIGLRLPRSMEKMAKGLPIRFFADASDAEKEKIIAKSRIGIAPIYFASGTRIKIIEYWAHGKAVVSTGIGAEGLKGSPGTVIASSDDEFARECIDLLKNKEKASVLGKKNYGVFMEKYELKAVYKEDLFEIFEDRR
jgi:glycosyltransferase involved in cell wall biosynthesis